MLALFYCNGVILQDLSYIETQIKQLPNQKPVAMSTIKNKSPPAIYINCYE